MSDNINPNHYKSQTSLECIEAMEIAFGIKAVFDFCVCNAWKYIWRYENKNGLEDLKKARWYVNRALCYYESEDLEIDPTVLMGLNRFLLEHQISL